MRIHSYYSPYDDTLAHGLLDFVKKKKDPKNLLASNKPSKSEYKGGFIDGKNTPAYNHDYYLKNKAKWDKYKENAKRKIAAASTSTEGLIKKAATAISKVTDGPVAVLRSKTTSEPYQKTLPEYIKNSSYISDDWALNRQMNGAIDGVLGVAYAGAAIAFAAAAVTATTIPALAITAGLAVATGAGAIRNSLAIMNDKKALDKLRSYVDERAKNNEVDPETGLYLKKNTIPTDKSKEADCKAINPGFEMYGNIFQYNCMLCSLTYDLRQRGYEVAAGASDLGLNSTELAAMYDGVGDYNTAFELSRRGPLAGAAAVTELEQNLENHSRGILVMADAEYAIGHAVAYEIQNGKLVVYDCQTGTVYKGIQAARLFQNYREYYALRTDDKEPNYEYLKENGCII